MSLGNGKIQLFDGVGFQQRLEMAVNVCGSIRKYARECEPYYPAIGHPYKITTYLREYKPSVPTLPYYYALSMAAKLPFEYLALGETDESYSTKKIKMLENHINELESYASKLEHKVQTLKQQ